MALVTPRTTQRYGWRRGLPDHRDHRYAMAPPAVFPLKWDNSVSCPPVMNQGQLGSCVAHGVTAAMRYERITQGQPDVPLSRLQLYYDARKIEGMIGVDSGLETRDAIKSAVKVGVAPESDWPYDEKRYNEPPPEICYTDAAHVHPWEYRSVSQTVADIKTALINKHLVIIGISVYGSLESEAVAKTGVIPLPHFWEKQKGGHCLYLHGYNNNHLDYADGRNSWGTDWGRGGDFSIPFKYLCDPDLSGDFWIMTRVGPG